MAGKKSIADEAERVLVGLATIDTMCRAARLRTQFGTVDLAVFAVEVSEIVAAVLVDAAAVTSALRGSTLVRLRVVE